MAEPFNVACVQNCAGQDIEANITQSCQLIREAAGAGAELICLPEYFSCLYLDRSGFKLGGYTQDSHPAFTIFSALAEELGVWLLLGSLAIQAGPEQYYNRSYLLDNQGRRVAQYDKLHLFDVDLAAGESYRESDTIVAGDEAVLAATPWGLLGMSICYDLRFAALYRAMAQAGASFLTVPAAFTRTTGQAHWHALLRSRAIETGSYVFAPCQYGAHGDAESYGHSLIIDPWGEVLADAGEGPGFILCAVDPERVRQARAMIPALEHDREFKVVAPHRNQDRLSA